MISGVMAQIIKQLGAKKGEKQGSFWLKDYLDNLKAVKGRLSN